ncbi:hypothetical protein [Streptomyces sp. Y1]|uniref:Uncharacterized protein n=1 Tax=Streptomyces sp. Y1 TaxID=3238634 RepID=A0AB39TFF7_9ACTN
MHTSQHTTTGTDPPPAGERYCFTHASDITNSTSVGAQLSGSGTNPANLVTCGSDANSYVGKKKPSSSDPGPMDSMLTFEDKVRSQIDAGNTVLYEVILYYEGNRNVPYKIEMSYIAWDKDGHLIGADRGKTPNLIYTAGSGWKNLGKSIHSGTGEDAGQYGD